MTSRPAQHIRSNIVGYIAVFIALSGTAYAVDGSLPGTNTVGSDDIIDGEVQSLDIKNEAVNDNHINTGAVRSVEVRDASLGSVDVADNALTGADISGLTGADVTNESLGSSDVAGLSSSDVTDFSLTGYDIGNNQINGNHVIDGAIRGPDVRDGALGSEDVRQEGLRGEDIDEGTLDFGCRMGMIKGFALVKGDWAIPSSFSSDPAYIESTYNCSGGAVSVRNDRRYPGNYTVLFEGVSIDSAVGTTNPLGGPSDWDNIIGAWTPSTVTPGAVGVDVRDGDGSAEHGWFYIVVM